MSTGGPSAQPLVRVVSALGIGQIVAWGSIYYAITVLAAPMAQDLGWSLSFTLSGFALATLVGGASATRIAAEIDRRGARLAMIIGSLAGSLGMGLLALVHEPVLYFAAWIVLGVAFRLTLYDAAFAALVEIAGHRARRPISWLTVFGGLASTLFWPLAHWLEGLYGWRGAWGIMAAMNLVICLPIHALVLGPPRAAEAAGGEGGGEAEPPPLIPPERQSHVLWMLAAVFALTEMIFAVLSVHMITMLTLVGLPLAVAVGIASVKGIAQTSGRLVEVLFGRNLDPMLFALIAVGALPLAFLVFAFAGASAGGATAFSILYGLSNGLLTILRGAFPLILFGRQGYAGLLARMSVPSLFVKALAPLAFASLIEQAGAVSAFVVLGLSAVPPLLIVLALALRYRAAVTD